MWRVSAWKTRGGRTVSIGRGWDSQAVNITLSAEGYDDQQVRLTPHMIGDLLSQDQEKIESYGPGYTLPHAIQDFIDGKWLLSGEQVAWCLGQKVEETPDFFPAPGPMRVDEAALSLARESWILYPDDIMSPDAIRASQAFGGVNLFGGTTDEPPPLVHPAAASRHYRPWLAAPKESTLRFLLQRRWRRLRQRWLLGNLARKIGIKLPW